MTLPKKKEVPIEFFLEQLVKNNQTLQSHRAEYRGSKKKRAKALQPFFPKVAVSSTYQSSDDNIFKGNPDRNFQDKTTLQGKASLNLFKGFGDMAGLREGERAAVFARYDYYTKISKLFLDTLDNLLQVNEMHAKLEAAHLSLTAHEKVFFIATKKLQNKAIALGEFKQAESEKDARDAQRLQLMAEYEEVASQFYANTGLVLEENYIIDLPKSLPSTYEEAEALMLKNNFDIQAAHAKVGAAHAKVIGVKSKFLPNVDLFAQWDHTLDKNENDISKSLENPKNSNKSFGIQGSWNIFNGFGDVAEHQEEAERETNARCGHQATLLNAKAKLKATWAQYQNALKQRKLYENTVQGYEIAANSVMINYESGGSKGVADVARIQDTLANAKERLARNERVLRLNAWRLTILIGELHKALKNLEQ